MAADGRLADERRPGRKSTPVKTRARQLRSKNVAKYVVGNVVTAADSLDLVKAPVDTEINPALAVLLGGLAEAVERTGHDGADVAVLVDGDAIELIGANGEMDIVTTVEIGHDAEKRTAERGVARGIGREGRREIGTGAIVSRSAQGSPSRVALSLEKGIARAEAARSSARIVLPNGSYRPPEIEIIFAGPTCNTGIRHGNVDQRKEARILHNRVVLLGGDNLGNLIVESGRRAQVGRAVIAPKNADFGLLRRAQRRRVDPVAAEILYFLKSAGVSGAGDGRRCVRLKSRGA